MDLLFDNIAIVLVVLATFAGLGAGGFFTTEAIKVLANLVGEKLPGTFRLQGKATWVVAALVAVGYVLGFDIEMLGDFSAFEGLDVNALQVINAALLAIGANLWHDKVFDK